MELNEQEIELCQKAFSELDTDNVGSIKVADLKQALDRVNFFPNEFDYYKMISEIDENNTGQIKFSDFLTIYHKHKLASREDDDNDTKDAFVAMGGNEDGTGTLDANKLVEIVKKEFELTIDMETLIKSIDNDKSGEIDFEEFKTLLKTNYSNENINI